MLKSLFAAALLLTFTLRATAQSPAADYFAGKWNVLVKGTPNGDARMTFVLENKDNSITGVVQDTTGQEISRITSAQLANNEITLYFNAQGYDLNLNLKKKDEDHVTGTLLNMFDAEGDRVKVTAK